MVQKRVALALALYAVGCVRELPREEDRSPISEEDTSALGFSMADVLNAEDEYRGELSWMGGGLYYEVSPSESSTTIEHAISGVGAQVYQVNPCPDGSRTSGTDSNAFTDCGLRLETEVELSFRSEDGSLDELWHGTLAVFGVDRWELTATSLQLAGSFEVMAGPSGPLVYTWFAKRDGEAVVGRFGGMTETSQGRNTGAGTGFNAAQWTSRRR